MQYLLNQEEYNEYIDLKEKHSNLDSKADSALLDSIMMMFISRNTELQIVYDPYMMRKELVCIFKIEEIPKEVHDAVSARIILRESR